MRTRSLTTRFVLTLLLSTAVPLLAFGWFARGGMRERFEQQVVQVLLRGEASRMADGLDARLEQLGRDGYLMRVAAAEALVDRDFDAFDAALDLTPGFHRDFQHVVIVDETGEVLHRVDSYALDEQRQGARRAPRPTNLSGEPWFEKTVHGAHDVYWVDRHLSPLLHGSPDRTSFDPADYSLGLAMRVLPADGTRGGVLYALVDWRRFQDVVDDAVARLREDAGFPGAEGFVCDAEGVLLAATERRRYGQTIAAPALCDALRAREPSVVTFGDGGTRLAGLAPVGAEGGALDWRSGVDAPQRELFATVRDFDRLLVTVSGLIAAALVVWAVFASSAILRPVRWLAAATERVARGDLTTRVPVRGQGELAQLGRAFNEMAADLDASQRRLRTAEREAAWAEMARQVAHEIKNPLTPMRVSAQMVQRAQRSADPRLPELVERLTRTVVSQTEQLARIASDFRHFAGRPEPRLERVDAHDLLDDVAEDFAGLVASGEPKLVIERDAPGVTVRADRAELRRVFLNLVQNAIAAAGPTGRIVVRAEPGQDGGAVFRVRDDGPGVPEDVVGRLFEPYFTTRTSGTGLGLAICRRIVESHGGSIRLASAEPGATEFVFSLPVSE